MRYLRTIFVSSIWLIGCQLAAAQEYPGKLIKIVVPFPPGGTLDVAVRPLANQLSNQMAVPVIIENRAGADGSIGVTSVAKSQPDGYTLLATTVSFAVTPALYPTLGYDPVADFAPIRAGLQGLRYAVIVNPSVPARSMSELIALGRKADGHIAYSSPGIGNGIHIASELFNRQMGTRFIHVPYKGSAPALTAVVSGEVQLAIMPPAIAMPLIRAGKLKVLGFTGRSRLPELPDVPTMAEAGAGNFVYESTWIGLFAPARTLPSVVNRVNAEVRKALGTSSVRDAMDRTMIGWLPDGSTAEAFGAQVKADVARYAHIVRGLNIRPE